MGDLKRKVRIKDIARIAGVSPTTVSNVIHKNEKRVSEATAARIEKILEDYGYVPDISALMLTGSSRIICVLAGNILGNIEHQAECGILMRILEEEIHRRNYSMMLHFSDSVEEHLDFVSMWKAEGVITVGFDISKNRKIQVSSKMPIVSIDGQYEKQEVITGKQRQGEFRKMADIVPNVSTDDFGGGYLMGQYLIQCGHKRIHFLAEKDIGAVNGRWDGLKQACMEAGIYLSENDYTLLPHGVKKRKNFYKKCLAPLAFGNDALFFSSDFFAMEAEGYLQDLGIRVPEEISVAGFGNTECSFLGRPRLTTIHTDIKEKAVTAVKKLFGCIRGDGKMIWEEKIPIRIVMRESVMSTEELRLWG